MSRLTRTAWGMDSLPKDQLWRQSANCGPDVADWFWFTEHGGRGGRRLSANNRAALALCDTCPVLAQCLADELEHPTPYAHIAGGRVWGVQRV